MRFCDRMISGSVAEWLKAHDSKSCGRVTVSEVRILSLPPRCLRNASKSETRISLRSMRILSLPPRMKEES